MAKLVYISAFLCVLYLQWVVEGQEQNVDKCKGVICPRGRMCVSREENGSFTTCDCPISCPAGVNQTVCTFYNKQFNSRCEMHKYACAHGLTMKVKNEGICGTNAGTYVCTEASMFQFPSRYLEWIMLARAKSFDPTYRIDPDARALSALTEEEREKVLLWEFESIDSNNNDLLDNEEIQAIFDDVLRFEPCIYGFLLSCDLNGRSGIGRREWHSCFPLAGTPLQSK